LSILHSEISDKESVKEEKFKEEETVCLEEKK